MTERELHPDNLRLLASLLDDLPQLVIETRLRAGLTQAMLAAKLGMNWRTIYRLERLTRNDGGDRPSYRTTRTLLLWLADEVDG